MDDVNWQEEQQLELESLESIFVDEFELITEDPITYEVTIKAEREDEANNYIVVKLKVEYPTDYPKVAPKFQFKNLSPVNLSITDFNQCHEIFKRTAEEMLGEQMIFAIIENVREYLQEKNDVFVEQKQKEEEEERIREANIGKKFIAETRLDYTPVNETTFSAWLKKYMGERAQQREEEYKNRTKEEVERDSRKTGKNIFLEKHGLAGSNIAFEEDEIDKLIEEEEATGVEAPIEEEKAYYDEDLFDDEDVDDLDDVDLD